jgi:hypothetical protein
VGSVVGFVMWGKADWAVHKERGNESVLGVEI